MKRSFEETGADVNSDKPQGKKRKIDAQSLFEKYKLDGLVRDNYDGSEERMHILFDINGTLGSLTKNAKYTPEGKVISYRPHIEFIKDLQKHGYLIGIWSSATRVNVQKQVHEIWNKAGLEEKFFLILDRSHTEKKDTTDDNSFATVKPIKKLLEKMPKLSRNRVILVEDSPEKFLPEDSELGLIVSKWEDETAIDGELKLLSEHFLKFDAKSVDSTNIVSQWNKNRAENVQTGAVVAPIAPQLPQKVVSGEKKKLPFSLQQHLLSLQKKFSSG